MAKASRKIDWKGYFDKLGYNIFNQAVRLQELIKIVVRYAPKNGMILEVGCGSGFASILLSKMEYGVIATDIDKNVFRALLKRKKEFNANIKLIMQSMLNLSIASKSLDVVFHQGLFEHFNDEIIIQALKEQKRVARYVIFDVPNNRYKLGPNNIGNERLLGIKYYKKLIHKAGLEIVDLHGRGLTRLAYILPYGLIRLFDFLFTTSTIFVCTQGNVDQPIITKRVRKIIESIAQRFRRPNML